MAIKDWPAFQSDKAFWPESAELVQWHNNKAHESPLAGDIQTQSVPGARWGWILNFPKQTWAERGRLLAFLTALNGMEHRVRLFDPRRPTLGTLVGETGVVLSNGASQFGESVSLFKTGIVGKTLLRGAWLNVATIGTNGQLVQVVADATANGSNVITVEIRHPLRAAVSSGAGVTLLDPTGLYIHESTQFGTAYDAALARPMSIQLREAFSA